MGIYNDKKALNYAISLIDDEINEWDAIFSIHTVKTNQKIPEIWCIILKTSVKTYFVTDLKSEALTLGYSEVNKKEFILNLKNFEDEEYKIYYKQVEQHLVGYLLDFFVYYVEMPEKIITEPEVNLQLYKKIQKNKKCKW